MPNIPGALTIYDRASDYIATAGLDDEVAWQRDSDLASISETMLLREAAWVVLCSGFRESIVRKVFDHISLCFCDWESAAAIIESYPACYFAAQASFNSTTKLSAIVEIARQVDRMGFENLKPALVSDPVNTVRQFPYIGPITARHLAKNLGLNASKPDRHLVRVAKQLEFKSAEQFCEAIADATGEPVKVVDLVVWRYFAGNGEASVSAT